MNRIFALMLGILLVFSFGCPSEEAPPPAPEPVQEGPIDCGRDFNCFVDASADCSEATTLNTMTINMFGLLITTDTHMEIRGLDDAGKCMYYTETVDQRVALSEELKQSLREDGATEEEIAQQEQNSNEMAKSLVGMEMTCRVDTAKLNSVLKAWRVGNLSTEDFAEDECETVLPPAMQQPELPKPEPEPGEEPEVEENETVEEEPEGLEPEEVCEPVALSGWIELGVYEEDAKYYYEETEIEYDEKMNIGDSLGLPGGGRITLKGIVLDAECGECGEVPTWTYKQTAVLNISVPNAPGDIVAYAGPDEHGLFNSSFECRTVGFDGKCVEYEPDGASQYYVHWVVAEKICR